MIPSLIAFLVHLTVVYVFAQAEAWSDHMLIKNGYSIDHVRAWFIRAGVIALSMVILVPLFGPFEGNDLMGFNLWTVLGFCLMSAFGFSAVFRYQLNKERELSPWYVSPSSHYDWFFIRLTHAGIDGQRKDAIEWHSERYTRLGVYKDDINSAGQLAYTIEAVLFSGALVMAISQII